MNLPVIKLKKTKQISEKTYSHLVNTSGFTLLELLIVIMIMGLLFGVGLANYRDFARRQSLLGISRKIKGDLRLAQQLAITGNKPTDCVVLEGYQFNWVSSTNYQIEALCSNSIYAVMTVDDIFGNTSMSAPSPDPLLFRVLANGTNITASLTATITLTQAGFGNSAVITVTSAGDIH